VEIFYAEKQHSNKVLPFGARRPGNYISPYTIVYFNELGIQCRLSREQLAGHSGTCGCFQQCRVHGRALTRGLRSQTREHWIQRITFAAENATDTHTSQRDRTQKNAERNNTFSAREAAAKVFIFSAFFKNLTL